MYGRSPVPSCSLCPTTRPSSSCLIHLAGMSDPSPRGIVNVGSLSLATYPSGALTKVFFELVDHSLVFCGFGPYLAEILLMTAVRSLDKCIDNGAERGWVQVSGC